MKWGGGGGGGQCIQRILALILPAIICPFFSLSLFIIFVLVCICSHVMYGGYNVLVFNAF